MEQYPFMMWSKRRLDANNPIYDDLWEEQAFAEDAAGGLGGCIWPPRSYSCSFCRREFRSAQALGGHMNVHRRDRARLKQSPDPNHGILHQMAHPNQISHDSISPQIHQLFYNPSPKSALGAAATPISPSGVPCHPVDGGHVEHGKFPPYLLSFQGESRGRLSGGVTFVPSRSNSLNETFHPNKGGSEKNNNSRSDPVESNFLLSLNLATRTRSSSFDYAEEEEEEEEEEEDEEEEEEEEEEEAMTSTIFLKRRRMDEPSVPIFLKRTLQSAGDADELSNSTKEELDLELRLGERPKGKLLLS